MCNISLDRETIFSTIRKETSLKTHYKGLQNLIEINKLTTHRIFNSLNREIFASQRCTKRAQIARKIDELDENTRANRRYTGMQF